MTENRLSKALLVVAKRPAPGQTKTRLTPHLTPEQAAELYECFLLDTLSLMRRAPGVQPVLAYLPAGAESYFRKLAPDFELVLQRGNDLGSRLDNVTTHYLDKGYEKVVVMDSDSPTLPVDYLAQAYTALGESEVVIGPCEDGGYYLIGMTRPIPRLLRDVRMSTPYVVNETLQLADREGLKVHLLPEWHDVDNDRDLARLRRELEGAPGGVAYFTRSFLLDGDPIPEPQAPKPKTSQ